MEKRLAQEIMTALGFVRLQGIMSPRGYIVAELIRRLIVRRICERYSCVVTLGDKVLIQRVGYAVIISSRGTVHHDVYRKEHGWFTGEKIVVAVPGDGFENIVSMVFRDIGVREKPVCNETLCLYSVDGADLVVSRLIDNAADTLLYTVYLDNIILSIIYSCVKEYMGGRTPGLPVWLSPIQVRFIPLGEQGLVFAENMCAILLASGYRCDIDDTTYSLGDKIRRAAAEWVPYIVSIGEREVISNTLNIRIRKTNDQVIMYPGELMEALSRETAGYPTIDVYYPVRLSERALW